MRFGHWRPKPNSSGRQRPELVKAELRAQLIEANEALESTVASFAEALAKAQAAQRASEQAGVELYRATTLNALAEETVRHLEGQLAETEVRTNPFDFYTDSRGRLNAEGLQRAPFGPSASTTNRRSCFANTR